MRTAAVVFAWGSGVVAFAVISPLWLTATVGSASLAAGIAHVSPRKLRAAVVGIAFVLVVGGGCYLLRASRDSPAAFAGPAWGPPRPLYRCDRHALCGGGDHISFDSTLNNPVYGDETQFLSGKIEGEVGGAQDLIHVAPGDVVQLRLFVANDGDPDKSHPSSLLAQHLTARLELPREPAETVRVVGWLTARNAYPAQVFDSVSIDSDEPFSVHLVSGSAELDNNAHPDGLPLPDSIVDQATLLGYRQLNGLLNTCFCHAGSVLAKLVIGPA